MRQGTLPPGRLENYWKLQRESLFGEPEISLGPRPVPAIDASQGRC
ncbi:MAG: hypothetical protein AB1576_03935 [Bacillota bacterium]